MRAHQGPPCHLKTMHKRAPLVTLRRKGEVCCEFGGASVEVPHAPRPDLASTPHTTSTFTAQNMPRAANHRHIDCGCDPWLRADAGAPYLRAHQNASKICPPKICRDAELREDHGCDPWLLAAERESICVSTRALHLVLLFGHLRASATALAAASRGSRNCGRAAHYASRESSSRRANF